MVPEAFQNSLKANDWVSMSLKALGGKGGGKAGLAQGSASVPAEGSERVVKGLLGDAEKYVLQVNLQR